MKARDSAIQEKVSNYISAKGLKDSDVAKKGNIPPSTFTDWKKGKSSPKYEKLTRIANALGCSVTELGAGYLFNEEWDDTPITIDFSVPVPVENKYIDMYQELKQEDKDIINRLIETLYNAR